MLCIRCNKKLSNKYFNILCDECSISEKSILEKNIPENAEVKIQNNKKEKKDISMFKFKDNTYCIMCKKEYKDGEILKNRICEECTQSSNFIQYMIENNKYVNENSELDSKLFHTDIVAYAIYKIIIIDHRSDCEKKNPKFDKIYRDLYLPVPRYITSKYTNKNNILQSFSKIYKHNLYSGYCGCNAKYKLVKKIKIMRISDVYEKIEFS